MKLGGATFLGRGPPPTHRLHTTQYTLSVWRDQDIKISDTSKVGQRGGRRRVRCGADLEPCVTVLPRVGAGAGYTLPTNQIYLVFSVTREPSRDPSRHVGDLEHPVVSSGHLWSLSPAAGPGTRETEENGVKITIETHHFITHVLINSDWETYPNQGSRKTCTPTIWANLVPLISETPL